MSKDLPVMKELQYLWKNILDRNGNIDRSISSKKIYEAQVTKVEQELLAQEGELKKVKSLAKNLDLELNEIEEKISKLEGQFSRLRSEREIDAHNKEVSELKFGADKLETELLDKMESQENLEGKIADLNKELEDKRVQVALDIKLLNEKIDELEKEKKNFELEFEKKSEKLSSSSRSRFLKLIKSKDGIAIAELSGEICGHCNFQIPSSLASSVNKGELENCSNCGRYLYKQG